jgi:hypothetical protein
MDPATIALIASALVSAGGSAFAAYKGGQNKDKQMSSFTPAQESALEQALAGITGQGGGVESALQYFTDLLQNNPEAFAKFEAPAMRQFNEEIIPGIAERFSGAGAGAQSSGAFQRSLGKAGATLSEQLQAMREGLRGEAGKGILGLLSQLLGARGNDIYKEGGPGFLGAFGEGLSKAGASAIPALAKYAFRSPSGGTAAASNTPTQAAVS